VGDRGPRPAKRRNKQPRANRWATTGARRSCPSIPGIEGGGGDLTTRDLLQNPRKTVASWPRRILRWGRPDRLLTGQALAQLGAPTSPCCNRGDRLLRRTRTRVLALVRAALEADGVRVSARPQAFENGEALVKERAGDRADSEFDRPLCAIGRQARLSFGPRGARIPTSRTNRNLTPTPARRSYPNIYAAGDGPGLPVHPHGPSPGLVCRRQRPVRRTLRRFTGWTTA